MKKNQLQRTLIRILILMMLVTVLLTGFAVGKYAKKISVKNTVTFTAKLAEKMMLVESKIERQPDGSYETQAATITGTQSYELIPGLDIPKDPRVVIEGKTEIPAYLYIQVNDAVSNDAIKWQLEDHWVETELDGKLAYAYSKNGDANAFTPITTDQTIYILKGNQITVNQGLLQYADPNSLTFSAYLIEVTN